MAEIEHFVNWIKSSKKLFFVSAFTQSTRRQNQALADILREQKVPVSGEIGKHLWRGRVALLPAASDCPHPRRQAGSNPCVAHQTMKNAATDTHCQALLNHHSSADPLYPAPAGTTGIATGRAARIAAGSETRRLAPRATPGLRPYRPAACLPAPALKCD